LGAAAIVVAATRAEFRLSDYDDLLENLAQVPEEADEFVLCDLGADNANLSEFVKAMKKIAGHAKVTYIDHHFMAPATKTRLRKAGVRVVHDERDSAAMLAYVTFADRLPERARMIALCGAVTDYMDSSTRAKKMMEQADRQFVLLEAAMLSYALGAKARDEGFPETVVRELAEMKLPHEIPGVPEAAVDQLKEVTRLEDEVKAQGTKKGRIAYMETTQYSTGNVAKLLIGAFQVPVGVAFKEKQEGWYEVSTRATSECRIHLGRTLSRVAAKYGGSGGGHRNAAGCRIAKANIGELLDELSKKV
jgi:single-stranded-DNA-specific exonuclease